MALSQHRRSDKLSDSGHHGALHVNIRDFTRLCSFPEEVLPNRGLCHQRHACASVTIAYRT